MPSNLINDNLIDSLTTAKIKVLISFLEKIPSNLNLDDIVEHLRTACRVFFEVQSTGVYIRYDGTLKCFLRDPGLPREKDDSIPVAVLSVFDTGIKETIDFSGISEKNIRQIICLPLVENDEHPIGVVEIGVSEKQLHEDDIEIFSIITGQAANSIKNALHLKKIESYSEEISSLYKVGKAIGSTLEPYKLLNMIAASAADVLKARGCIIRIFNKEHTLMTARAAYGIEIKLNEMPPRKVGEGVSGLVVQEKKAIIIDNISTDQRLKLKGPVYGMSVLCVPLTTHSKILGTISVIDKKNSKKFTEADKTLLTIFASQASQAYENAELYTQTEHLATEMERQFHEVKFVQELSTALLRTIDQEQVFYVVLTAVTAQQGLRFNRSLIFLINEENQTLECKMAIGPDSIESLKTDWNMSDYKSLLDFFKPGVSFKNIRRSRFYKKGIKLSFPLNDRESIPVSVLDGKLAMIYNEETSEEKVDERLSGFINNNHFAVVPVLMKDTSIGILIVDNYFNRREIVPSQLNILQIVANQTALALANARFFNELTKALDDLQETQGELVKKEKMAVLGEMSAGVAHDIRNPLMAIGGFAHRLRKQLGANNKYLNIIIHEASRLEHLLDDVLVYSKEVHLDISDVILKPLIEETLSIVAQVKSLQNIKTELSFSDQEFKFEGDKDKLQQVLISVCINAIEAMEPDGGRLRITGENPGTADFFRIYLEDTGRGIKREDISKIFIPFFTSKSSGTGLGLPIAQKIIKRHGGNITFDKASEGFTTRCVISLPALQTNESS